MKKLAVVTSFILFGDERDLPIFKAIKNTIENSAVESLTVITEKYFDKEQLNLELSYAKKVVIKPVSTRPTFGVLFEAANKILREGKAQYVALMNGDVSFWSFGSVEKAICCLDEDPSRVLALTRHDLVKDDKEEVSLQITLYSDAGLPNYYSADAWIFSREIISRREMPYHMGQMNCDTMLADDLCYSGYKLLNPCLDIPVIHMEEEIKYDDFYKEENSKEKVKQATYDQIARTLNLPYKSYGTPWCSTDWISNGYTPDPISVYPSNALWLFLPTAMKADDLSKLVAFNEVIASLFDKDLFLFYEGPGYSCITNYINRTLRLNKRVYLHPMQDGSSETLIRALISGKHDFGDSFGFISDLSRLGKGLLTTCQNVLVDLRFNQSLSNIAFKNNAFNLNISWFLESRYSHEMALSYDALLGDFNVRECTLITSVFKSDEFIDVFVENSSELINYSHIDHLYLISDLTKKESEVFFRQHCQNENVVLVWNRKDPGLYDCWNLGIQLSTTPYVSNANVDDLRCQEHVVKLCQELNNRKEVGVVASALFPFDEFSGDLEKHQIGAPWYSDQGGGFEFSDLGRVEYTNGKPELVPHNMPHCMPIWRKALHDKLGWFDENTYGTYADWAFWLKATWLECNGYLLGEGLGFYYINLESHNRRGSKLDYFHRRVENEFLPHFLYSDKEPLSKAPNDNDINQFMRMENQEGNDFKKDCHNKSIAIHGADLSYGKHRNSFNRLIESLLPLHSDDANTLFLPFIERYFIWGDSPGEAGSENPKPIEQDWIGIVHVPFDAPKWFHGNVYPETIFETDLWKRSLKYCKGLIALSEDLRRDIECYYPDIPTLAIKHPTDFDNVKHFDFEKFKNQSTIVQAGDWLRKLQAIHQIDNNNYRKVMLLKDYTEQYLQEEIAAIGNFINPSVEMIDAVSNEEYDDFLSSSVVICWLYATAANNLVLECIARHTPLVINPLPSVVEYLGEDYPLYANDISDIVQLAENGELIYKAHIYLKEISNNRDAECLTYQTFYTKFAESDLYRNL